MHIKKHCKNLLQMLPRKAAALSVATAITLSSGLAVADDTEIFFGRQSNQPNVMFVLDQSGSMTRTDGTPSSRLERLQSAMRDLLNNTNDINAGLIVYNGYGIQLKHAIRPLNDETRAELLASVDNMDASQTTPSVAALYVAMQYFTGQDLTITRTRSPYTMDPHDINYTCSLPSQPFTDGASCWGGAQDNPEDLGLRGQNKGPGSGIRKSTRLLDPNSYTLGPATLNPFQLAGHIYRHPHCNPLNMQNVDDWLDSPACVKTEIRGNAKFISPILNECQANHIVLMTDGKPVADDENYRRLDDFVWTPMTTEFREAMNMGAAECVALPDDITPEGGRCGVDLAKYMADNLNIVTHTIGLELDLPWLEDVSEAAGGIHRTTNTAQSLIDAFEDILSVAHTDGNTFVSPAITVDQFSGLSHREDVYLPLFEPSATAMWNGNLKRYAFSSEGINDVNGVNALNANGSFKNTAKSWWSATVDGNSSLIGGAASKLDADNRNVYTDVSGPDLSAPENLVHEDTAAITADILQVAETERANLIQWTRGVDVLDVDEDPTTTTRKQIGDPLHSRPILLTYGPASADSSDPESIAFFGTNQGYLHAIDTRDGTEAYSYIPKELLPNLNTFYENERRLTKVYGLDGDITSWVQDKDNNGYINGTDKAYIYVGMRRGGNNYYALDVSDKTAPEVLWTIKGGVDVGFEQLGQTWSKPLVKDINIDGDRTTVLIFGGGYAASHDNATFRSEDTIGNAIYIVDAETGDLIWKTNATDFPDMKYSIPSDLNVIDIDGDSLADQIYVGDLGGQVWRFDFNKENPTASDLLDGAVIANFATDEVNGFRKFFYQPDIALIKGDGVTKNFLSISIGSGNRAHPLDTAVENRFYMLRQYDTHAAPDDYGVAATEAELYNATDNKIGSTDVEIADDAKAELLAAKGWMLELTEPGEKVLAKSLTYESELMFTTYLPESEVTDDSCAPSLGGGRLYRVNVGDATPASNDDYTEDDEDLNGRSRRHTKIENGGGGIPDSPYLYFDSESGVSKRQGTATFGSNSQTNVKRIFWSEQTD